MLPFLMLPSVLVAYSNIWYVDHASIQPLSLAIEGREKKAGGKEHLTALLAAAISSNTSLMSKAVKPEP